MNFCYASLGLTIAYNSDAVNRVGVSANVPFFVCHVKLIHCNNAHTMWNPTAFDMLFSVKAHTGVSS